jgi:cytochrome c-type biogenesis protein CcmH
MVIALPFHRMRRQFPVTAAFALALVALAGLAATAQAVEPRASLPDIEDEVMCPSCQTPLALAFSPQAERERLFIRREIAKGRTKEQIKQALVREFGDEVLAQPKGSGFDLAAYLVPAAALALAAAALGIGLTRWRRRPATVDAPRGGCPSPTDSARLERDLSRYDL